MQVLIYIVIVAIFSIFTVIVGCNFCLNVLAGFGVLADILQKKGSNLHFSLKLE